MRESLRGRHLETGSDAVGESIRVLHVDDDPDFVAVASDSLEAAADRITVETATSAEGALDALAGGEFDAVVSDYDMPRMNGIELLEAIRETSPDLPFVLFTGKGSEEVASEAISRGVTDYLQKSFGTEVYELLANRIENAVSQYRAKRRAAESERRVRELTEATQDILWVFAADLSEVLVINSAYEDIWGRSVDALYDDPHDFLNGVHPEDRERMKAAMKRLSNGESADVECRVNAEEGYRRWVWIQGEPIRENGETVRVAGFARDITERRNRERELEATKDQVAQHNQTLRELYRISADREAAFEEKVQAILELGRDRLGTTDAFLSGINTEGDELTVLYASGSDERLEPGATTPLSESYCRKAIADDGMLSLSHASNEGWTSDPAMERWGYETYISSAVRVCDAQSGTLCFVDRAARPEPFSDNEQTFVHLAAQWVSYELERRQREERLERYKEYTDDMLDAVDDVFYVLDEDGRFRRWNQSLLDVTGYTAAEVAGAQSIEFFPDADRERIAAALDRVFEDGPVRVEAPLQTKDGESILHEFIGTRVEGPDGEPMLAGVGRDITDRKARERKLTRTKELLDQAQHLASVGGWEVDVTTDPPRVTATDEFYHIHGLDPEATVTVESLLAVVHPDDRDLVRRQFREAIETATGYDMEVRLGDEENPRWIRALCEPVCSGGEVVTLRGSVQDITEQKLRERELEETRERMEIALEATGAVVWNRELDAGALSYYPSAETLYGTDVESLDEFLSLVHPEDRQRVASQVEASLQTESYECEFRIIRDGEVRWIAARGRVDVEDGSPVRALGIDRDITDRKRREQQLRDTNERLEEFTSVVSHDLRNPLSVAEGRIELARLDTDSEHLDSAKDALDRMGRLIDELLAAAREGHQELDIDAVAIPDVAKRCWHNVETADATLDVQTDAGIRADEGRVEQLLENLLGNAVEHGGEDVTVTVGECPDGFYVADDGDGIDEADREDVFETGYSTAESGTGFGLWIVKEIADDHGWDVAVTEGCDGGARFEITGVSKQSGD